ncbi:unnamed protein product [Caenorhabditis brenneri]
MTAELNWSGLPDPFKRDVIKYLDFSNRCSLRECSSSDRNLIENCPITLEYIRIKKNDQTNGNIEFVVSQPPRIFKKLTKDSEYVVKDLLRIVGHPKTKLGEILTDIPFSNTFNSNFFVILSQKLKKLKTNFKIKTDHFFWCCHVENESYMLDFIERLDPNCLRRLYLDTCPTKETMRKLIETEQWKHLTEFSVAVYQNFFTALTVPIEELLHFENLQICEKKMRTEEVLAVVKCFRKTARPLNSFFKLGSNDPMGEEEVLSLLGPSSYFHEYENSRVYSIENTEDVLLVSVTDWFVNGVVRRKDQLLEDVVPRFSNWSEHIKRLGEGMPW